MLVQGASKINRLLRLTTLVMPPESMSHQQLRRPEDGECALKIEGHSYAMANAGDHDTESPQYYLIMGPDDEALRRSRADESSNGHGGHVSPDVVEYFAKVLEQTHADIKSACGTLREDATAKILWS